jgi:hypothetical protein
MYLHTYIQVIQLVSTSSSKPHPYVLMITTIATYLPTYLLTPPPPHLAVEWNAVGGGGGGGGGEGM